MSDLKIIESIRNSVFEAPKAIELKSLETEKTALVIVDMVNGFVHNGALASPNVKEIIPQVSSLMNKASQSNMKIIAFADCHTEKSSEFSSFPVHCLENDVESEIIPEIKNLCKYTLIKKNSTNGFHTPDFQKFLLNNPQIDTFIVCGDCTDICVSNFCLTLKTYFDQLNSQSRVIVPVNSVATYSGGAHQAEIVNTMSLFIMNTNGIELVKEIL